MNVMNICNLFLNRCEQPLSEYSNQLITTPLTTFAYEFLEQPFKFESKGRWIKRVTVISRYILRGPLVLFGVLEVAARLVATLFCSLIYGVCRLVPGVNSTWMKSVVIAMATGICTNIVGAFDVLRGHAYINYVNNDDDDDDEFYLSET